MSHAILLKALLPAPYSLQGQRLGADIAAHGAALDEFQQIAESLVAELDPRGTTILLPEWESAYGLPGNSLVEPITLADRRNALVARINDTGGLSKPYFKALLESAGYEAVIDQPRAFVAGVGRCGDRLYAAGACVWYFRLRLRKNGVPLTADNKARVAAFMEKRKPGYSFFTIED